MITFPRKEIYFPQIVTLYPQLVNILPKIISPPAIICFPPKYVFPQKYVYLRTLSSILIPPLYSCTHTLSMDRGNFILLHNLWNSLSQFSSCEQLIDRSKSSHHLLTGSLGRTPHSLNNNQRRRQFSRIYKNLLWHYCNHRRSVEKRVHEYLKVGGGWRERAFLGNTLCLPIPESHRDNINSWQVLFYILCNIYCN